MDRKDGPPSSSSEQKQALNSKLAATFASLEALQHEVRKIRKGAYSSPEPSSRNEALEEIEFTLKKVHRRRKPLERLISSSTDKASLELVQKEVHECFAQELKLRKKIDGIKLDEDAAFATALEQRSKEPFVSRQTIPAEFLDGCTLFPGQMSLYPVNNRGIATIISSQPTTTAQSTSRLLAKSSTLPREDPAGHLKSQMLQAAAAGARSISDCETKLKFQSVERLIGSRHPTNPLGGGSTSISSSSILLVPPTTAGKPKQVIYNETKQTFESVAPAGGSSVQQQHRHQHSHCGQQPQGHSCRAPAKDKPTSPATTAEKADTDPTSAATATGGGGDPAAAGTVLNESSSSVLEPLSSPSILVSLISEKNTDDGEKSDSELKVDHVVAVAQTSESQEAGLDQEEQDEEDIGSSKPLLLRNDSFNKAIEQGNVSLSSSSSSSGKVRKPSVSSVSSPSGSEDNSSIDLESECTASSGWFEAGPIDGIDLDEFRFLRRLSVLKEESGEESEDTSSSVSSITTSITTQNIYATVTAACSKSHYSSSKRCRRKQHHRHHHCHRHQNRSEGSHSLDLICTKQASSLDSSLQLDVSSAKLARNISDPLCLSNARSTSRPLVMMAGGSGNSLHSSGTLVALSISDSDIEDIDKDSTEESGSPQAQDKAAAATNECPLVAICESPDAVSGSVYESPLSSIYESPISSPSYYATPMERSPWQSPQSSVKGLSPTGSISSFKITITPSPFNETSSVNGDLFLNVPNVATCGPGSGGGAAGHRRSQSLKSPTRQSRMRTFHSALAFDLCDGDTEALADCQARNVAEKEPRIVSAGFIDRLPSSSASFFSRRACSVPTDSTTSSAAAAAAAVSATGGSSTALFLPTIVLNKSHSGDKPEPKPSESHSEENDKTQQTAVEAAAKKMSSTTSDSEESLPGEEPIIHMHMDDEDDRKRKDQPLKEIETEACVESSESLSPLGSHSTAPNRSKNGHLTEIGRGHADSDGGAAAVAAKRPEPTSANRPAAGVAFQRSVAFDLSVEVPSGSDDENNLQSLEAAAAPPASTAHLIPKVEIKAESEPSEKLPSDGSLVHGRKKGILKPPPPDTALKSFPSLPETFLLTMGISKRTTFCTENLSEQDIENKFTSLSLAFKTDKLTLANRLELQQRQRDTSERNIETEIEALKTTLATLGRVTHGALDSAETRDVLASMQQQIEVLKHSAERVSSSAEVYGAVQQEARISRAIEIMLLHVENLKRIHDRDHTALEDAKKVLSDHNLSLEDASNSAGAGQSNGSSLGRATTNSPRLRSISVINNNGTGPIASEQGTLRRASIAATSAPNPPSSPPASKRPNRVSVIGPTRLLEPPTTLALLNKVKRGTPFRKTSLSSTVRILSSVTENHEEFGSDKSKTEAGSKTPSTLAPLSPKSAPILEENNNNNKSATKSSAEPTSSATSASAPVRKISDDFASHVVRRSRMRSTSLIEPVKEEEENNLLEEIDQLALKRDSSPAPPLLKKQFEALKRGSYFRHVYEWYQEVNWPWDFDETVLGIRYVVTGVLLFAALVALLLTFFGSGKV